LQYQCVALRIKYLPFIFNGLLNCLKNRQINHRPRKQGKFAAT
jgi:hypothetical protein